MVSSFWKKAHLEIKYLLFTTRKQQAFLEDIASLIEDGVPINNAVETYSKINRDIEQEVARSVLLQISQGKYLADGLSGWYPPYIVEIIRAGEEGGILPQTLRAASAALTQRQGVISSLANSLIYPFTVICMGLGVAVFINNSIFESFRGISPEQQWPSNAQLVVLLANTIQNWWWLILLIIAGLVFAFVRVMHDYIGDGRQYLDKLPIMSLYRKMTSARLMETLGLLIANGLVFKKALKIVQYRAHPYLAWHLITMEYRLGSGKDNLADVLDTGLISQEDLARLRLIAQSKGFEHALVRQGQRAADEGTEQIRITGRIMGGFLLGVAALLTIFLITSIYAVGMSIVPA